jgi:hypothetical protein
MTKRNNRLQALNTTIDTPRTNPRHDYQEIVTERNGKIQRCLALNGGSLRSAGFPPLYARRRAAFRELDICPSPVRR